MKKENSEIRAPGTPARASGSEPRSRRLARAAAALLLGASLLAPSVAVPVHQAWAVPDDFADLAEKLLPSVVNISTTQTLESGRMPDLPQFPDGSPFEDFFKDFFENRTGPRGPQRAISLGSGFVVDAKEGYIVTNNHVIRDADEITVVLQDDTVLKATIRGVDEKTDLALLKVETDKPLHQIEWGDSDAARVGEWVVAIGNPFGLGGSVTTGIISAKTRDINAGPYDSFIQTDASINKGNSGGPLFDERGRVIGINTVIFSPSGGSVGVGFAVPSNIARQVVGDLVQYGQTRRGWIGVRIQTVTDDIAEGMGMTEKKGALVSAVTENGPAAKAGLKEGDVILRFDGRDVAEMRSLPRIVSETPIGKTVDVDVLRAGKTLTVKLDVAQLEEAEKEGLVDDTAGAPAKKNEVATQLKALGFSVATLDAGARKRFGIDNNDLKGVVVDSVDASSDAAMKGIQPGSVLVQADQKPITGVADLQKTVAAALKGGKKLILFLVDNGGTRSFVAVKVVEETKKGDAGK
ncbi:Do family serine endopeptidase [Phaeovibrio sulfidiphilus]|uniref:Probable periplasmic serine endoprotease DegP-like n=2 Tax=Phaeovibrio sulfidiphilus TaxID=1220600 RepID=A0A8J6Z158_9PROT|nr:Do family serine endopeptidase [Phaeovibrio sulfidiphilus]